MNPTPKTDAYVEAVAKAWDHYNTSDDEESLHALLRVCFERAEDWAEADEPETALFERALLERDT